MLFAFISSRVPLREFPFHSKRLLKKLLWFLIQIFHSEQFGDIRTAGNSEQPQFCLSDLCKILNLRQGDVVKRLTEGVVSTQPLPTNGGTQKANFVNEDGLYDDVLSKCPILDIKKSWIVNQD